MVLKLRNPGWPPEGASGGPVSVFMTGHIAPEDEREQRKQKIKRGSKRSGVIKDKAKLKKPGPPVKMWALCVSRDQKQINSAAPKHSKASKA